MHLTGGISALYGAAILGPRLGRFEANQKLTVPEFAPASVLSIVLGTFILWFGWYGFNAGSTTGLAGGSAEVAAHCACTTTIAAAIGGVTCFLLASYQQGGKYDIAAFANGILGGLVGITAGCSNVDMAAAALIGFVSGLLVPGAMALLEKLKIDDPISAFPVHGACGMWGVLATGLFDLDVGVFYGADFGDCFGPNVVGILVISLWCGLTTIPLFFGLKAAGMFRVSVEQEGLGLDVKFVQNVGGASSTVPSTRSSLVAAGLVDVPLDIVKKVDDEVEASGIVEKEPSCTSIQKSADPSGSSEVPVVGHTPSTEGENFSPSPVVP